MASQSAGITGESHRTRPDLSFSLPLGDFSSNGILIYGTLPDAILSILVFTVSLLRVGVWSDSRLHSVWLSAFHRVDTQNLTVKQIT